MKTRMAILLASPLVLVAGCIQSHRAPVVYVPPPTTTIVTPTSERPVVRVYPDTTTLTPVPTVPGTQVVPANSDLGIADTIRKMFDADPSFSRASKNVRVGVFNGTVTLRGTVPVHEDSDELQRRIQTIPGVVQVDNQLEVAVH